MSKDDIRKRMRQKKSPFRLFGKEIDILGWRN